MSAYGQNFAKKMRDKVATKLLKKFDGREGNGRLAILKQGDKVWNPTIGEYEIGPDTKYFMFGVQKTVSESMVNGTTIRSGDKVLTVSVYLVDESGALIDYVPQVKDKVLMDGQNWSIVATTNTDYAGADLIINYKIQVRK